MSEQRNFALQSYVLLTQSQGFFHNSVTSLKTLYCVYDSITELLENTYNDPMNHTTISIPLQGEIILTQQDFVSHYNDNEKQKWQLGEYAISLQTRSGGLEVKLTPWEKTNGPQEEKKKYKHIQIEVVPQKNEQLYTVKEAERYFELRQTMRKIFLGKF